MSNRFGILLDILKIAFKEPVSENDYHRIVEAIRNYDKSRISPEEEKAELRRVGWPETYHPCDYAERIRFFLNFGEKNHPLIQEKLRSF